MAAASSLAAAGLSGLLALATLGGPWVLAMAVALVQGLLIAGWYRALQVPGYLGGTVLTAVAAVTCDVLVVVRDDERLLTPVTAVLGLTVVGGFLHQLLRRPERSRVTASLSATVTLAVAASLGSLLVAARETEGGGPLVVLVACAAGAAAALDALPLPTWARAAIGVVVATLIGAVVATIAGDLGVVEGVVLGAAGGAVAVLAAALVRRAPGERTLVAAALPLIGAGPVAYALGRILIG